MIYADNAATTRLDPEAFEAMRYFLVENYANPSQPYSFSRDAKRALKRSREIIAECINAEPEEIIFTSGGSESDNQAVKCCKTEKVYASMIEHHAVLNACKSRDFTLIPVDEEGIVKISDLKPYKNSLVSVMLVNNETGTIQPVKTLAEISHSHGAIFHTDAVQAIGHIDVDVKALGVDMLSASAHKFNGPRGAGFLYVRRDIDVNDEAENTGFHGIKIHSLINGGSQEFGLRAGTENVACIVGMAKALENNCRHIQQTQKFLLGLEQILLERLISHKLDFRINGNITQKLPGILNLSFKNANGERILHRLDLMGIYISTGSACDGMNTQISHVIKALKVPQDYAKGTIRISLGKFNSENDALTIADALAKIIIPTQ